MTITHKKGEIINPAEKVIHCQAWVPKGTPRGVFLFIHGLTDHSGRYMNLVHHLVPRGFALYGCDLPGHGKSAGIRTYIDHFQEFPATVDSFVRKVQEWQPDSPLFLYGHSIGGLIALHHAAHKASTYRGVIFSGTLYAEPEYISPFLKFIGNIAARVLPRIRILEIDETGISRDKQVVEEYREDPLVVHAHTTARLGVELQRAVKMAPECARRITIPALILQGEEDPLVNPDGAKALYQDLASPDKTLRLYPGYYHELHNEPQSDRQQVLDDLTLWLAEHLP